MFRSRWQIRRFGAVVFLTLVANMLGMQNPGEVPVSEMPLRDRIRMLEPWKTRYSTEGWIRALVLAKEMQELPREDVIRELNRFGNESVHPERDMVVEWSKALLLLRLTFRVELSADVPHVPRFGGWTRPDRVGKVASPSWPVKWMDGLPAIAEPHTSFFGAIYRPEEEYKWCFDHFEFRDDLDEIIERLEAR